MKLNFWCVVALGLSIGSAWSQGQPHVHSAARLGVTVDTNKVTLQVQAPLAGLMGFERPPRGEAETRRAAAAIAALKSASKLFRFTAAAGCTATGVELESAVLKLGRAAATESPGDHANLDATYVFNCANAAKATAVDVGVFDAFGRISNLKVDIVTAKGQFKRDLKRPAKRISLVRKVDRSIA
jgi:Protein of unknown function (DUF2796)